MTDTEDKDGISITCSPTVEGCRVFGQLIDLVEQLISEWYPGLAGKLDHRVPCHECVKCGVPNPHEYKVDQMLPLIAEHKLSTVCGACGKMQQLMSIVPDLLLADLDTAFLLDVSKVIYKKEKASLLGTGAFGEVYHGKYMSQSVAVKLYTAKEGIKAHLKQLRLESKELQRLHHPCLVCMVGVTVHPTMSLVLEEAPLGTLQDPLLKEQRAFSRIVMYRIAIQVASALGFLHSINVIFHDVKADNVLLWSLSPDHLINCKVTDFNTATHADRERSRGLHGTKGFIAPEVANANHAKEHLVYDHRADIFSYAMFVYQLIARRYPFHDLPPFKIEAAIEEGQRPQLKDIPVAETGLFYMTHIMKLCWADRPDDRPKTEEIIESLSAPALQLIMNVTPIISKYNIAGGCIVIPNLSNEVCPVSTSSEVWICCDEVEGIELTIFHANTMVEVGKYFVKENQVRCIKQCGDHIWVTSRAGLEYGVVDIFNKNTKDLVHHFKMSENAVSCITNSNQLVYLGTMEGYCFAFPMDVQTIQSDVKPKSIFVSEYCIDGMILTNTSLWASSLNQINFLNANNLDIEGAVLRTKNTQAFVGMMMLSDSEKQVWSAHVGGVIMSSWDVHQRVHLCDVDVGVIAEEKCHVGDRRDQVITAMCTGLDTVWIGLASGHIIVFGMNPLGDVLTCFRSYHSYVCFLSAANYPGPCGKEECMMLSGGQDFQPDDNFKKLLHHSNKENKQVHMAGTIILWEVLPAKYMQQMHYLHKGVPWLNHSKLKESMIDTGFFASIEHNFEQTDDDKQLYSTITSKFISGCGICQLLNDGDPNFLFDFDKIVGMKNSLGVDKFGQIHHGRFNDQLVSVKLFDVKNDNAVGKYFKRLYSARKSLLHPLVVNLVGVTVHPKSLILEGVPHGTLQTLLMEQRIVPRIILFRFAIQVASALHFLHSINITRCNLNNDCVLLWSLSPDSLINCKVIPINLETEISPHGNKTLDSRADIYFIGTFLHQLLTHFHSLQPFVTSGKNKKDDTPVTKCNIIDIIKTCQSDNVENCNLSAQHIVEWLSVPALQMILNTIPFGSEQSVSNGCIVVNGTGHTPLPLELWISFDKVENIGTELKILTNTVDLDNRHFLTSSIQVCCISQIGGYIWVASQVDFYNGRITIFKKKLQQSVRVIRTINCIVSCITNVIDHLVYIGTVEGYCFAIPMDIQSIHSDIWSHDHGFVSEYCIDGVLLTQTHLWVSSCDQIYFMNPSILEVEGVEKRTKNKHACVGKMMLCDNEDEVWSAHLGGVIMSSWDAHQRVHLCDVDVGIIAEEKCHVSDRRDQIITAMCTGLDTVWIGLASGHIIMFGMNPPGEVLTYFRPYHSCVKFLSSANYPGPCGKEECMMLSGGKLYQPDDSFSELPGYKHQNNSGQPMDTAGAAILWEVLPAKYVRQVHYLRDGKAWLSYDRLNTAMIDTGFTESLKYCKSSADVVSTQNNTLGNGTTAYQQDVKIHNDDTLCDDALPLCTMMSK